MLNQITLDNRSHAFNVGIAIDYNPTMALWLSHLAFWAEKNLANESHIHDGHVWCYDKLDAICEYFPYFTRRQVETMINNSVDSGLVIKGNYNKTQYDRTCWYALTPKAFGYFSHLSSKKNIERLYASISHNCEMDFTEWGNRFTHFVTTIPDTDPDTDPDINHINKTYADSDESTSLCVIKNTNSVVVQTKQLEDINPHDIHPEAIQSWIEIRKRKKAVVTKRVWMLINNELNKCPNPQEAFDLMIMRGWSSIKAEWVQKESPALTKGHFDYKDTTWAAKRDLFD